MKQALYLQATTAGLDPILSKYEYFLESYSATTAGVFCFFVKIIIVIEITFRH